MAEEIKEIGLKVAVNKNEAFWTRTKEKAEEGILAAQREIIIDKEIVKLCDRMISAEVAKNKD